MAIALVFFTLAKGESSMSNDIGSVRGISGTSMGLNTQAGQGTQKPSASGNASPGGTKPAKPADGSVPMPK